MMYKSRMPLMMAGMLALGPLVASSGTSYPAPVPEQHQPSRYAKALRGNTNKAKASIPGGVRRKAMKKGMTT